MTIRARGGYGREFLAELESHFAHLGPGANHAPVAGHLRREFAAEIERAWQEDDDLDVVENLRTRMVHHAACFKEVDEMTCGRRSRDCRFRSV